MNLLLIAAIGAGIYEYNKNEEFKEKADKAGSAIKDLFNEGVNDLVNVINSKKEEK